ncbi:Chitinase 1 [Linnemannia exigua]|uniref:chitinase n=1 Tax=Linnemannia exigua TaxID=604196 RepID=A0AAD4DG54_9FUNG|nr:Chitinase 1 [Linnemannia exigua]
MTRAAVLSISVCLGLLSLGLLKSSVDAFNPLSDNNLVNYWGQNSYGAAGGDMRYWQKPLGDYCQTAGTEDVIVLAFLHVFNSASRGLPRMDLANQCEQNAAFPGTGLLHCPRTGEGVKMCQSKGKAVILSLGGAAGAYGFSDDAEARDFAHNIWNLFLGGSSGTRPLDDAILDGVDLDIEGGSAVGYPAFIAELRSLFAADTRKQYYITAAPQCPFPDAYLGATLQSAWVDMVFVQYYNNYCGTQAYGSFNFNFEQWDTWAKTISVNKDVKVYLGVPASRTAANAGYVSVERLQEIMDSVRCKYSSFGGVMMWDMSQSYGNLESGTEYSVAAAKSLKRPRNMVCGDSHWILQACAPGTYCTTRGCDFIKGPVLSCLEAEKVEKEERVMKNQLRDAIDLMWGVFDHVNDPTWDSYPEIEEDMDEDDDMPVASDDDSHNDASPQHLLQQQQKPFAIPEGVADVEAKTRVAMDTSDDYLIDFIELETGQDFVSFAFDPTETEAANSKTFRTQVRIRTNNDAINPLWRVSFFVKRGETIKSVSRGTFVQNESRVVITSKPKEEAHKSMVIRFVIEGVRTLDPLSGVVGTISPDSLQDPDTSAPQSLPDPAFAKFEHKAVKLKKNTSAVMEPHKLCESYFIIFEKAWNK